MTLKRFTGPEAGSQKYDLLTALAVAGLNGTPGFRCSMMRLIAVVTARYNWRTEELTVGQREMARLWAVDERTVKREIKRLIEARILLRLRPGVRGRVAAFRLDHAEILRLSAPHWGSVGPDFSERMAGLGAAAETIPATGTVVRVDFAPRQAPAVPPDAWGKVLHTLALSDPGLHKNWFAALQDSGIEEGVLRLTAPSQFVARYVETHHLAPLIRAAAPMFPGLRRIEISART